MCLCGSSIKNPAVIDTECVYVHISFLVFIHLLVQMLISEPQSSGPPQNDQKPGSGLYRPQDPGFCHSTPGSISRLLRPHSQDTPKTWCACKQSHEKELTTVNPQFVLLIPVCVSVLQRVRTVIRGTPTSSCGTYRAVGWSRLCIRKRSTPGECQ